MKWRNTKKSNCKPTPINTRQLQSFSRYFLRLRFGSPKQHKQNHLWPHIKIKYSENRNQNQSEISPNLEFGLRHFSTIPRIPLRVSAFRDAKGPWTTEAMLLELMHLGRQLQCSWPAELHQLLAVPPRTQDDPGWPRMTQDDPGDPRGRDGGGWTWPGWGWMIWYDLIWTDVMWLWCLRIRLIRSLGLETSCDTKLGAPDIYSSWRCHGNGAPDILYLHQS